MDELSPQARERLARPAGEPLRPPPLTDHAAVARWRAEVHAAWLDGDPPAAACGHARVTIAGVRCLWAPGPTGAAPGAAEPLAHEGPVLVYLHGGGYSLGSPEVAVPITERLAAGGLAVVSVDYRLAPEHPWPAAVDDAVAVFRSLRQAAPGRRLAVGGDSAGGSLALSVAQRTRGDGGGPEALVLFSPHVDHGGPLRPGDDTDEAGAAWLRAAYCGSVDPADPRISPLRGDLRGLPPTLVQVGTRDGLLGQAARLARAARRAGSEVTLDVWDGLWHTWQYHRELPEADQALAEAASFVVAALSRSSGAPQPR